MEVQHTQRKRSWRAGISGHNKMSDTVVKLLLIVQSDKYGHFEWQTTLYASPRSLEHAEKLFLELLCNVAQCNIF